MSKILGPSILVASSVFLSFGQMEENHSGTGELRSNNENFDLYVQPKKAGRYPFRPKLYISGTAKPIPIPTCWENNMVKTQAQGILIPLKEHQYRCMENNQEAISPG
jgi:hypothetical protein